MKTSSYCLLLILVVGGCTTGYVHNPQLSPPLPAHNLSCHEAKRDLDQDFERFQLLLEKSLTYREETLSFYDHIQQEISQKMPLSGADLDTLNNGLTDHLHLRAELYQAAYKYKAWVDQPPEGVDPELRLQGVILSLSAALALYDNYLVAFSLFHETQKLRRYINARHPSYDIGSFSLTEVTTQYNSLTKRHQIRQAISIFQEQIQSQSASFQDRNSYFHDFITQSPSYNSTLQVSPFYILNRYGLFLAGVTTDTLLKMRDDGVNLFSLLFGNSVGLVQTRKGYLYNDPHVHDSLLSQLRAGDILLEKTPFRLTDKLIPGHWGHVAIWLGSEQDLIDLGIWDHPAVIPYHEEIRAGKRIIEALRCGVTVNSLHHFLNVDDLAILRPANLAPPTLAQILTRAFRQIGKPYDFNFDIETNDRIVCSELIYVSYANIQWPTQKTLGRFTVSPTHIAEKVGEENPFSVITLYLNGKPVTTNQQQEFLNLL
ncbi:MAG: Poxvirus G6 [Proteobacteria bacterium]|nr:Poxvirus G6 [Pseudomonadota bacterium]MBU1640755.1 Poxvirus G6 [Pseudomonadota bacterium]